MKHIMITLAIMAVSIVASAKCVYFISGDILQLNTKVTYSNGDTAKLDIVGTLKESQIPDFQNVVNVKVGNSVTEIGANAFTNFLNLSTVRISKTVETIGSGAFWNNNVVSNIILQNGLTTINPNSFRSCSKLGEMEIPDTVTSIKVNAFRGCVSISNLTFGTGLVEIGSSSFYGCKKLKDITIPNSVMTIGNSAFQGTSLTNLTFKGKTLEYVQGMDNYPWGITDTNIINVVKNEMDFNDI